MRLINADVFEELFDKQIEYGATDIFDAVEDALQDAPTIDAVPVVRCRDCRYSEPMSNHGVTKFGENALNCTQCRGDDGYGYAGVSVIYPYDYCSDGAPTDCEADADA